MNNKLYFGIAIRLIILFSFGMLFSFVPDQLRGFFGDTSCDGLTYELFGHTYKGCHSEFGIDADWQWGARHYWYFWMMFLLFILSLVNIILAVVSMVKKYYPNL